MTVWGSVEVSLSGGCENSLVSENQTPPAASSGDAGTLPTGEEIGVFASYQDARKVVTRLLGGGIPARSVSIVGGEVTLVERIIARYGYGRAAMTSALTGSWIGVFAGLIYSTLIPQASLAPLVAGGLIGAGVGMMTGMILYTTRGSSRPTYRSMQQVIAAHYRVIVDSEVGGKAKRLAAEEADGHE